MLTGLQRPTAAAWCPVAPSTAARLQQQHVGAAEARGGPRRCRSRHTFAVAAAAAGEGGAAGSAAPLAPPTPASTGRKFVFAVDGKPENEQALLWASTNLFSKGDKVYLAHCLSDPRTPSTAVGSSSAATQWSPARDEQRYAKEYFLRLEHESSAMLQGRYVPLLQFKGIEHEELLLRLKVHRSAAGIAEAICSKAADLGADAVIIGSLGAGVLADFGSVARWASENSKVPALLLPPSTMDPQSAAQLAAPALVVAGADNLESLHDAFEWALQKMARPGDEVYVVHAEQLSSDDDAVESRKRLVQEVFSWQQHSSAAAAPAVNIVCDVIFGTSVPDESMAEPEGESGAGAQLCKMAADVTARAVVLSHHGASMMRELMWGHLTMHCTKFCSRPLVVLEPRHVGKPQASGSGSMMGSQLDAPRRTEPPQEVWARSAPRLLPSEDSWSLSLPSSGQRFTATAAAAAAAAGGAATLTTLTALATAKPPAARRGSTAYSLWDPFDEDIKMPYGPQWRDMTVSDPEPEAGKEQDPAPAVAPSESAATTESEESEPEPTERKSTTHLQGAAAFRQPPDCELEVDGVVFPVHSAIVCNASTLLDCLLASFLPAEEEEEEEALVVAGGGTAGQATPALPRLVLKRAGPAAEGEPESPLTTDKLEAFLRHVYGASNIQAEGLDDLLHMVDYLQAASVKNACDRELEASAKVGCIRGVVPQRIMEQAARHKLPRTMAACMAGTVISISKGVQGRMSMNLFSSSYQDAEAYLAAARAPDLLNLISEELKFQLVRATTHTLYTSEFAFRAQDELPKLTDGIADALNKVPGWGLPSMAGAPCASGYRLAIAEPGEGSSEPPKTIPNQKAYLQGKSDLFISRADLEIELDGVRFPAHSAILARSSMALDVLLTDRQPSKPGKRLRILVQPAAPAAPGGQAAGAEAVPAVAPAGAAGEGAPAAPAAAAQGGVPAAEGQAAAQPVAGGAAAAAKADITPEKLLCFLQHCYCPDRSIEQDALPLLQLADIFGAAKMREAAAQALTEKLERACKNEQQPVQVFNYLPLAARCKLRRMMGLCGALFVKYLVQYRDVNSATNLFTMYKPVAECLNQVLYVLACKLKEAHSPPLSQLLEDCTAAVARVWQEQAD